MQWQYWQQQLHEDGKNPGVAEESHHATHCEATIYHIDAQVQPYHLLHQPSSSLDFQHLHEADLSSAEKVLQTTSRES